MKNLKKSTHSLILNYVCIFALYQGQVFAETTRAGTSATYTDGAGSWTFYDSNGRPVPSGLKYGMVGATFAYFNEQGELLGLMYDTASDARHYTTVLENHCSTAPDVAKCMRLFDYTPTPIPGHADLFPSTLAASGQNGSENGAFDGSVELNGTFDPLKDAPPVRSGPFNTAYNGITIEGSGKPMDADTYAAKSLEMTSFLWGVSEVGEKLCKPVGEKHAPSLVGWWYVIKNYVAAEKVRDELVKKRIEILKERMDAVIADSSTNSSLQLKAIEYQIESLNISIDSLSGSTLFGLDSKGAVSRATSRIPWREQLLVAAVKGAEDNKKENVQNHTVYNSCISGVKSSASAAAQGCKREKIIPAIPCTDANAEECGPEKRVPDPVPGSCEMANSYLPLLEKGPLKDMATLYYVSPIPSKEINERLIRIGTYIDKAIAMYPVSNDSKYDWTTPLKTCKEDPLLVTIKNNGIICPANAPESSYDKSKFANLGATNDPILQLGRYTLGVNLNQVEYEFAKRMYDESKAKGMTDFQAETALNAWVITTGRGQAYVTGGTYDKVADAAYHEQLSKDYNLAVTPCSTGTCNNFTGAKTPDPDYNLPPATEVSESAKAFLMTMGITAEPALSESTVKFQNNWNITDLYLGQPIVRELYFKYVEALIEEVIDADKAKLLTMLESRQKLITLHAETKRLLQTTPSGGGGGAAAPSLASGISTGRSSAISSGAIVANQYGSSDVAANANTNTRAATQDSSAGSRSNSTLVTGVSAPQVNVGSRTGSAASASSSRFSTTTGPRGAEYGRSYAVSPASRKKIDSIKKTSKTSRPKLNVAGSSSSGNALTRNDAKIVASISKQMGSTFDSGFVGKHSSSIMNAVDGISGTSEKTNSTAGSSTDRSYESGSGYSTGSYSYGSGTSGSRRSSTSTAPVAQNKNYKAAAPSNYGSSGWTNSGGEYRNVPKPDLFKKISNRYKSSRQRLGLEAVDTADEE